MSSNSTQSRPGRSTDLSGGSPDCAIVRALDFEIEPSPQDTCCPGLPRLDVRCDAQGRVTGILVSEQMTRPDGGGVPHGGPLPDSIGRLSEVYILWAYGNNLTGEIPHSLGNLRNLQNLNLSKNNFTGSIPDIFSDKPLSYLDLSHNRFTGPVPPLPSMPSSCYITSHALTERNTFTCLAGDPLKHKGACYDNLRPLDLPPCTPLRPPLASNVPDADLPRNAPAPSMAGPAPLHLSPFMIVLISMSATAAFVTMAALCVFARQQRRQRKRMARLNRQTPVATAKDIVYAELLTSVEQGPSVALAHGGAGDGLFLVVPRQDPQPPEHGQIELERVMLVPAVSHRREEEELFLPQEEVEIPELLIDQIEER